MSRSDICGRRLTPRPEECSTVGGQTNKVETLEWMLRAGLRLTASDGVRMAAANWTMVVAVRHLVAPHDEGHHFGRPFLTPAASTRISHQGLAVF